jgi:SulP family sulfate permease
MAQSVAVEGVPQVAADRADGEPRDRVPCDPALVTDPDVVVYRITGAFFFGAAAIVAAALDRIGAQPKAYVVDFSAVPVIDSTAAETIHAFQRKAARRAAVVIIAGADASIRRVLAVHGVRPPDVPFANDVDAGLALANRRGEAGAPVAVSRRLGGTAG